MINEIELRREALRAICRRIYVRRLNLFASAARGDFDRERSDVDFMRRDAGAYFEAERG
jgi:predicted nucleotidyltransferase